MPDSKFSWITSKIRKVFLDVKIPGTQTQVRRRIKDLPAETLAHAATELLRRSGKNINSLRLLYHALVVDPQETEALLRLSDFIRDQYPESRPRGNGLLSGILLEWMLSLNPPRTLDDKTRVLVQQSRTKVVRLWGFTKVKPTAGPVPTSGSYPDSQLEFDELSYIQFISKALEHIGSYQSALEIAHETLGYHAGFLSLKTPGPLTSFMDASHFTFTPAYKEWLNLDASTVERINAKP